jgi:glycosyltransferase involved in cell wall biosynthesis
LVSVVVPFYNTPVAFMREAVESVFAQSYSRWELLLVDDGSVGESTAFARELSVKLPGQVRYLEHPDHENRGLSAARMLGVAQARGELVGFLDSDDVWMPHKLEEQVALMAQFPGAAMIYGNTEYWYSWSGRSEDSDRDFKPELGVEGGQMNPPRLVPLFLSGDAAVPCTCSILVRKEAFEKVGGFEESFRTMYEDQVFYSKICLDAPVLVSERCWDRYRQHSASLCAVAERTGEDMDARRAFLLWLETYLDDRGIEDRTVRRALRRAKEDLGPGALAGLRRRMRKWLRRFARRGPGTTSGNGP